MRTALSLFVLFMFFMYSCGRGGFVVSHREDVDKQSISLIKLVFKPFSEKGVSLEKVEREPAHDIGNFKSYMVQLVNSKEFKRFYRYVWLSDDGKYFSFQMFRLNTKDGKLISFEQIEPSEKTEYIKVKLDWLDEAIKRLKTESVPYRVVSTGGNSTVYMVWDVYCPFCLRHLQEVLEVSGKYGINVDLIPFPIHGRRSIKGFVYFTWLSKREGINRAIKSLISTGKTFREFSQKFGEKVDKEYGNIPESFRNRMERFYANMTDFLVAKNMRYTPTVIYEANPETGEGYVHPGYIPFEEIIKWK